MEERLRQFIESSKSLEGFEEHDGAARFVLHQVVELARDCLQKSQNKIISSAYFYELSDNLEKLLYDVRYVGLSTMKINSINNHFFIIQWNPFWEATLMRGHPLWKGHLTMQI